MEALLAAAGEASYDLSSADLAEAFAGESPVPPPSPFGSSDWPAADTALRAAHAAYERRFGHVFMVCLEGCQPDEVLDRVLTSLRTRLNHTPEEERPVAADELRRIARARLAHLIVSPSPMDALRSGCERGGEKKEPDEASGLTDLGHGLTDRPLLGGGTRRPPCGCRP
jgi:2-oxo-4-hydroxy-4-carboxy-5-ureidoimidazoline decarboxylase